MNRHIISSILATLLLAGSPAQAEEGLITVYKSPTCGCCGAWIDHLKHNGLKVKAVDSGNMGSIKARLGVDPTLASCHTARVDGYTIEGHVPAREIKRLLSERPDIAGLSVPGMPMGSPGMEGNRKDPYQVVTMERDGNSRVYAEY
jgi:hypothetical protein